jgi:hypothetical protein
MTDQPAAFEAQVLDGFALRCAGNDAARIPLAYSTDPTVVYAEGETGISIDVWPEVPGDSVTLTDYTVSDDPTLSDSVVGVQVTIRSVSRDRVKYISADLFDLFHNAPRGMLGTVTLVAAWRSSGTNLGQDSNDRLGRTENYYLTVHRPSSNRT